MAKAAAPAADTAETARLGRPDLSRWQPHPWVVQGLGRTRIGINGAAEGLSWDTLLGVVKGLEALGCEDFWLNDHPAVFPDCFVTLGALATHTRRMRLGTMVSCAYYRLPALLARQAADVDRMSAGRLILGLGAGWAEWEFKLLGIPFPAPRERALMLRETIRVVRGLWASGGTWGPGPAPGAEKLTARLWARKPFTFAGALNRFERTAMCDVPIQSPRVPLVIGGDGEDVTFRLAARYGDMANFEQRNVKTPDAVRGKLEVLRRRCDEVGRPFDTLIPGFFLGGVVVAETQAGVDAKLEAFGITTAGAGGIVGTPAEVVAALRPFVDAGLRYFAVRPASTEDLDSVRLLLERVLPELQPN